MRALPPSLAPTSIRSIPIPPVNKALRFMGLPLTYVRFPGFPGLGDFLDLKDFLDFNDFLDLRDFLD